MFYLIVLKKKYQFWIYLHAFVRVLKTIEPYLLLSSLNSYKRKHEAL